MSSASLPLEQELNDALYRDLWTLRRAMLADPPTGDDTGYVLPPAHHYLPLLREACAQWTDAQAVARAEIPKAQEHEIKLEGFQGVNPVYEVAQRAPEVRRYWLVQSVGFLLSQAIEILENEGRPQSPPKSLPPLAKHRDWSSGHHRKGDRTPVE